MSPRQLFRALPPLAATLVLTGAVAAAQSAPPAPVAPSALPVASAAPAASGAMPAAPAAAPAPADADPFIWLEDVNSARSMAWVKSENGKTLGVLESDPHYPALYADALAVAQSKDRIPAPAMLAGRIFNFWQDATHVRGIWRATTAADYATAQPHWQTVLDLDALAKAERRNWVWSGVDCRFPAEDRCIVQLSDGGEDAVTLREYDLRARRFVFGGFTFSRAKQNEAWDGSGHLLLSRAWKPDELTPSGYPYIVKRLSRGQSADQAPVIFRGSKSDEGSSPFTLDDGAGHEAAFITRSVNFFQSETYLVAGNGTRRVGIPLKSGPVGMVRGQVVVKLDEPWSAGGSTFPQGSVVSVPLAALQADPAHLHPQLVMAPGPRDAIDGVTVTKSDIIVSALHEVRGRAYAFAWSGSGWTKRDLALPDNAAIDVTATSPNSDDAYLTVQSYLVPATLWRANVTSGSLAIAKRLPPQFDASKDVVEQFEATSKDGTRVPYFIVHPRDMKADGTNPTVIDAYGGFQISSTPHYSGTLGKLWLERGGTYVVANIRGGGEFGPAWHEAGLTTHRQRIYDDFYAVAQDLIARKITNTAKLGIMGGSNGGLLMGVEFTQHPEEYKAVDIEVPLLDMLRFEQIAAGASWVAEYGSVKDPVQRAFLASISPYNNLRAGVTYPEPFVWSTTKDDRVGPQHARKFAAKLASLGDPYLFYEVIEGGHGAGANLKERAHTSALEWTYFTQKLGS